MPRPDRRAQLLKSARRVFASKGYHDASIDDVIRRANVARGTFYNYFDSKRAVFQQVLEDLFRLLWESVSPIRVGPGEDVRAQIVADLLALSEVVERDPDVARILLGAALGVDPEVDRALARFYTDCRERLARALRKGQELGIVAAGDADSLAIVILGTLKEYTFEHLLGIKPPPSDRFLAELLRLFEAGWLRDPAPPPRAPARRRARSR